MDNQAIVRRFIDEYQSKGDESVADEILADDFVDRAGLMQQLGAVPAPA
ncbi:MAG TPA: hypothetical protein VFA62_13150 [Acidimicrobiia bacterium]|nr:hypothetical protein [Acidimicrobiia bacterium]